MAALTDAQSARIVEVYQRIGTIYGTALETGHVRGTIRDCIRAAGIYDDKPLFAGRVAPFEQTSLPLPSKGKINRYILTSAQNNTKVFSKAWDSLITYSKRKEKRVETSRLMVATFTYNKARFGNKAVKRGQEPTASDLAPVWYDPIIEPYICDDQVELAPGLIFCGEMNIEPTAVKPLQGLEVYTGRHSSIFPHVKMHMSSVASGKNEPTKFTYTTGTVTKRNYIAKKAGLKADFHHVYGGLIVEVNCRGDWFVRQLISTNKGVICDMDLKIDGIKITHRHRAKSITWGDIHEATLDPEVAELAWGKGGMMDVLRPEYQMMHDVMDFRARNGHTLKKHLIHDRFLAYIQGHDSVQTEVNNVARFLKESSREWCQTVVVNSNHDGFFKEWLRIGDYKNDPVNAIYFLEAQIEVYRAIRDNPDEPHNLLRWAILREFDTMQDGSAVPIRFLNEDESFVLLDIEHGMHGHLGPNGSRGSASNMARMGRKANRAHEHSAGILEGTYTSGLSGDMDQGYNKGPSSWSPSHIVTYCTGKRAIYTMWNGRWRA
jgi:hypothetical protein